MMRVTLVSSATLLVSTFIFMSKLLADDGALTQPTIPDSAERGTNLTLEAAFQSACAKNPELAVNRGLARWDESRRAAARIYPNPELSFLVDDFLSKTPDEVTTPGTYKIELSQAIELGGKRSSRVLLAEADAKSKKLESTLTESRVRFEVAQSFLKVMQAQELVKLASERAALATRLAEIATERVRAGKIAPIEETRLRSLAALAGFENQELAQSLRSARLDLSNILGNPEDTWGEVTFDLDQSDKSFTKEEIFAALEQSAANENAESQVAQARAELEVESAKAFPDVTLVVEANYQPLDERTLFAAGVRVPIPLFDRNQGWRGMAAIQAEGSQYLATKQREILKKDLENAHSEFTASIGKARILNSEIIPGLEQALDALETAYSQGRIGYLDVVDVQENLFAMREKHIEALIRYHTAAFRIENLIATSNDNTCGDSDASADGENR